ncbi:N-acetylmuramoyl-L-alanine amidase LytC precursor [Listeria grayi]|uniref:N-acetylmuramoyl-L-alanine amidase LytC n=1 Tax=Listeria grayi TaxID=1641 RepID=A0A378MHT1_LISGR|nr:N-acetylmuramoyl-L-alanine amidase LytC precursor [Listeria grayi]
MIVLDPGHGGNDPGTRGSDGIKEKNMTLKMANVVADKLRSSGAKVILTRSTDEYISLKSRADQSYEDKADAFISLHFDSNEEDDASVSGQTTYYYHNRDKELAFSVNQALGKELPTPNRGTRVGDFYVLRENTQPSILLELGYLSSQKDEQNITSPGYRTQVANAVYDGLSNYFAN